MVDFSNPLMVVVFGLAFVLPPIAVLSFLRIAFLRAREDQGGGTGLSPSELLRSAAGIISELFGRKSRSGLVELILLAVSLVFIFWALLSGLASLPPYVDHGVVRPRS